MKPQFIISILFILCALVNRSFAQSNISDSGGHVGTNSAWYVGWDNTTTFPLNIKQNETSSPQNIQFWTNGTQKMTLVGSSGATDGFLGLNITSPNYLLHLSNPSGSTAVFEQFTNGTTGTASTDGLKIGLNSSNAAEIHFYENNPMFFSPTMLRE